MSMLSSASTMQKLDPAILAQINIKMQKLLEVFLPLLIISRN